ncbi:MAG: nucleoside-diphosphate sugar epimerase/dehydratase [bacterium]
MPVNFQKILIKNRKIIRKVFFLAADAVSICFAVFLAFLVRFEGQIPERYFFNIYGIIVLFLIFFLPAFFLFRLYSFSWAYVSAQELVSLTKAVFLAFPLLLFFFFVLRSQELFSGFPRSTLLMSFIFIFIFSGAIRFAKRIYFQIFKGESGQKERILIVGAGAAGEQILRSILNSRESNYLPVGFLDDNPSKQEILIHGIKVLGKIKDIPMIVEKKEIEGIIIALPSAGSKTIKQAIELARQAKLKKIRIVPSLGEIISGQVSLANVRGVEMEDLLGREPVSLDKNEISGFLDQKKVLVTGAAGSIGSELCRQISKFNPARLLILDQDETGIFNIDEELKDKFPNLEITAFVADIYDDKKISKIFREFRPEIVFHAAAYKHVPLMEANIDEAVKNNVFGTKNIARAALENKAEKFVFISTDKAVKPISVMGATKRIGEMICQSLNQKGETRFISVRFGNVLDSRGSVIPIFREQIRKGGPVEITDPGMKRYFMLTSEACLLVLQSGAMGQGGEVFILDMGKPVEILSLAKEMIRLSGFESDKDIPIVFTGIRPGEKLVEKILTAKENTLATKNQKIFVSRLSPLNEAVLNEGLKKLSDGIEDQDVEKIAAVLSSFISTYHHG